MSLFIVILARFDIAKETIFPKRICFYDYSYCNNYILQYAKTEDGQKPFLVKKANVTPD